MLSTVKLIKNYFCRTIFCITQNSWENNNNSVADKFSFREGVAQEDVMEKCLSCDII